MKKTYQAKHYLDRGAIEGAIEKDGATDGIIVGVRSDLKRLKMRVGERVLGLKVINR